MVYSPFGRPVMAVLTSPDSNCRVLSVLSSRLPSTVTRSEIHFPSFLVMVIFAPGSSSLLAMSTLLTVSCARLMTVRPSSVRAKLSPEMALPLASVVTK